MQDSAEYCSWPQSNDVGAAASSPYRPEMGRHSRLLTHLIEGNSDANIRFDDLRSLLRALGFRERIRGSHHRFDRAGIPGLINIQRDGSAAKAYQVRQVRRILVQHDLTALNVLEDS